jgi:ABC-type bacteriocin/lantibiotic exporter with double-glycine peptidase domain
MLKITNFFLDLKIFFNFFSKNNYIALIFIFLIFLIKNIIIGFYSFLQVKFSFKSQYRIGSILFDNYLNQSFLEIKNINLSKILRTINSDSVLVVTGYILPALQIFTEIIILISYIVFVLFFEPKGFIVFFVIILFGYIIYKFFKNKLNDLGSKRLFYENKKIQAVNETFKLFKEIKVYKKESLFTEIFLSANNKFNNMIAGLHHIQILPRIVTETLGILALLLFIYFLINTGEDNLEIVAVLAIYVAVMARSLPSINRIVTAFQSLKFNSETLHQLNLLLLNKAENKKHQNYTFVKETFEVKDLSFKYPDDYSQTKVLDNLNFKVKKNEILLVRGVSGSGKSTLANILLGLTDKFTGEFYFDGKKSSKHCYASYVPQDVFLMDNSIRFNITFKNNLNEYETKKLDEAINLSNLDTDIKKFKNGLNYITGENGANLSGGQKQRIGIARALYQNTDLIVFDEPTSSLDERNENELFSNIKNLAKTKIIILISHSSNCLNITKNILNL